MLDNSALIEKIPYNPSLFVGREELLERITDSLVRGNHRVLSLVGPPGIGKSWLMRKIAEDCQNKPEYLVAKRLNDYVLDAYQYQENIVAGVEEFLRELAGSYKIGWDSDIPIDRRIESLAEASDQLENRRTIWFIDSLNSVRNDVFDIIKTLLAVWIGSGVRTYAVVAHRDDQRFGYPISWYQGVVEVPPFKSDESEKQIRQRLGTDENLGEWFAACVSEYKWDHPGLNDLIIQQYRRGRKCTPFLLRELLEAIIAPTELTAEMFSILCKMATFDEWTRVDLIRETGRNFGDSVVQSLFSHRLFYMDENIRKYKVAPGIKEVARAACKSEGEIS